jgi:hypothetical protein
MASFAELLTDVYSITNRPELVSQTKIAVRAATLKAHHLDYFPKDLKESGILWNIPAYQQSFDYRAFDARWRSFKYLRKYDAGTTPGTPGDFFKIITPEQVLDDYMIQRTEVLYLAGSHYEILSKTQDTNMLLGYYRHPDTTELTYDSWIALDHPWAIVFEAAALIFKQTGFDEQVITFRQLVQEQYILLQNNNILGEGY